MQIWAYHWLQAAAYDLQLMGNSARQRELMPRLIEHYHGDLRRPPLEWQFMPMLPDGSPEFSRRFPEATAIFDHLHMLHDNIDDVLSRPDLYPTREAQRAAILRILPVYLHRNHAPEDRYVEFHGMAMAGGAMGSGTMPGMMMKKDMGPRPPSARDVLEVRTGTSQGRPQRTGTPSGGHSTH